MKQQKYFNAKYNPALISKSAQSTGLHTKTIELLFSRGISTEKQINKFLNPSKDDFLNPFLLSGMKEAIEKVKDAMKGQKKILIFGDYDVDGVSATAVMIKTFKKLNYSVDYYLPNRFIDDYGLTIDVINKIKERFSPDLIITVDCGISCHKEVDYANSLGIDVIITDHHEIPEIIPNTIVINTKFEEQKYPFRDLCGTGVALKFSQALIGFDKAEEFLPIVAIATIADIVPLVEENRAIVSLGLKLMEKYLPAGIRMLFKENKLSLKTASSTDIAFKIAPKINSSGRMGDATDSLLLYLETNTNKLKTLIVKINEYNSKRQKVCAEVFEDCLRKLEKINISNERCIILSSPNWDVGILGIVCARLVETYNRPAFLFSEKDGVLKGSARSLNDINVHEMLTSMNDILVTFGGHKMAAGLTLKSEHLPIFVEKVNAFIFTKVSSKVFNPIYFYDLDVKNEDLTNTFFNDMQKLEPFGLNNAKPLLKISSAETRLIPLKNFPSHYNISVGKNLNLIYFNAKSKYFPLKYSSRKNFVFEIQSKTQYQFKGVVKNFDGGFELGKSFSSSLDAFIFEQLRHILKNKSNPIFKSYKETRLIDFIAECETQPFGTIFVATSSKSYRNFTKKYYSENIQELFVFDNSTGNGYNALYLYPTDISVFRNYNNIVFLDPVLDKSYLSEINNQTKGQIYIPEEKGFNKNLLTSLNLNRKAILDFFVKIKSLNGQKFSNILHLYNNFVKIHKMSFTNFYAYYLILSELEIIFFTTENEQIVLNINSEDKTNLSKSSIYNTLNYLIQITK